MYGSQIRLSLIAFRPIASELFNRVYVASFVLLLFCCYLFVQNTLFVTISFAISFCNVNLFSIRVTPY